MTPAAASRSARPYAAAGLLLLGLAVIVSLFVGVGKLTPAMLADPDSLELILASRLPRTLAAVLAGSGLAIGGLVMQTLARNRFVEPATAGTAQAAWLGILLMIMIWPGASLAVKSVGAAAAALAGTSGFLILVHRLPPTQPFLVPLVGLVYGGILGSIATFIAWQADLLQYLEVWTTGEFSGVLRGRYELLWIAGALVALAWWVADRLSIVALGEETSLGLGLNYKRMMQLGLVIVSVVSAVTVVVIGMIPFVGLVAPNLVSRLAGDNLRQTVPWVAGAGAFLVLACDIVGRLIRFPYEIPVGTVLGVVGAAIFLVLMTRRSHA